MNRKIFVTYGNQPYYKSLERIRSEAENTGEFDEILTFTDNDVPDEIKASTLWSHKRGGGYWLWKPWVVLKAMEYADDTDIIIYSDCGNTLFPNKGWQEYFNLLSTYNAVFFYNGSKMENWCRKSALNLSANPYIGEYYQIISGFFVTKGSAKPLFRQWYSTMLKHPESVSDVTKDEMCHESAKFIEHRHDQAVLSAIVYGYTDNSLLTMPENSERLLKEGQPVFNSRKSDIQTRSSSSYVSPIKNAIRIYIVLPYRRLRMRHLNYKWEKFRK